MPTLTEHTAAVIQLLGTKGIAFQPLNHDVGILKVSGAVCKVATVGRRHFEVYVNLAWFDDITSQERPFFPRYSAHIDFYLFAFDNALLALHFLDLREYALQLENRRDYWQQQNQQWGLDIICQNGQYYFHWNDNDQMFPLRLIEQQGDLSVVRRSPDRAH
jgi:hypothetical protein